MTKHTILKQLGKNNNIVILRPDKGDGTVIIDRDVYIQKIFEIIKDRTKFKELSTEPTARSTPKVFKIYERQKLFY